MNNKDKILTILSSKFLIQIVSIESYYFSDGHLELIVHNVENGGSKDVKYKLLFLRVLRFDFWRDPVLQRGLEVDVDDKFLTFDDRLKRAKLVFSCNNFGILIEFEDIDISLYPIIL